MSTTAAAPDGEYVRLHVTPLTPALLNTIIPSTIQKSARNISYHTIETFPERAYGFVELPKIDAEKLKQRLNGSILKGTKVRIETARPLREAKKDEEEKPVRVRKEGSKKRKRADETIPGVVIGDRNVKRGWTTPAAEVGRLHRDKEKKPYVKSKFTTGKECLFKTVVPTNVATKTKSTEVEDKSEKRKKSRTRKETVVHEFAKTTKYATFLRGPAGSRKTKGVAEYIEGKGWVDDEGNVLEVVALKVRKPATVAKVPETRDTVLLDSRASEDESESDSDSADESEAPVEKDADVEESETSSSDGEEDAPSESSSEEDEHSEVDVEASLPITKEASTKENSDSSLEEDSAKALATETAPMVEAELSESSEEDSDSSESSLNDESTLPPNATILSPSGLTIKIPTPSTPSSIHPLEALYKRAPADPSTTNTTTQKSSFSFFGGDADVEEDEESDIHQTQISLPMTPFTQRDFDHRGIRSAAPTPDTAHTSKRFVWTTDEDEDEEDDGSSPKSASDGAKSSVKSHAVDGAGSGRTAQEESDFQKWFWENRGDTNRAWKKRRKTVAKEKRQRENRKREGKSG